MTASTRWSEEILPDEAVRHAAVTERILAMQSAVDRGSAPGRAFHRKPVASLRGRLRVADLLPDHAAQGLFASPGEYDVLLRLSHGSPVPHPDAMPDVRGAALSVRDVEGPGALGSTTDRQDFLLINLPSLGLRDSRDVAAALGMRGGGGMLRLLPRALRPALQTRPFTGFAATTFHSCAPMAWGPYAAQVHLVPVDQAVSLLAWRDYRGDLERRLHRGLLTWEVQAEFYTDDVRTPIEDGRVVWQGERVTVGTVTCEEIVEAEDERFDPWQALEDHRPLGDLMRARRTAYPASADNRGA